MEKVEKIVLNQLCMSNQYILIGGLSCQCFNEIVVSITEI